MKILISLIGLLLIGVFFPYPRTTGPTEVGVRTVKWAPFKKRGVEEYVYQPGALHFFPFFLNDWHVLDTRLQNVEMTLDALVATGACVTISCLRPSTGMTLVWTLSFPTVSTHKKRR